MKMMITIILPKEFKSTGLNTEDKKCRPNTGPDCQSSEYHTKAAS